MVGLTRGTTREHVIRAGLESIAYSTRDVVDCMASDAGLAIETLHVDGGAAGNDFLMQFQADVLGCRVERPGVLEVTALGAAALAGLAVGFWSDRSDLQRARGESTFFEPALDQEHRDALYAGWQRAVERSREWA